MEHFNPRREIDKYALDSSTFDLIDVGRFHNLKCSTVFDYMFTWVLLILGVVLLGVDIYTCLNILVFHRWSSDDYKPYAYSVAKWIFTGCIIFQFVLLLYHWVWAIHTYRTRNIALAYVNNIARHLYTIKSYDYHCLFNSVEQDNFFDWACFLAYFEMDSALQILVADTPRQVINILTLRYYATDEDSSNDIIENIKKIASSNIRLSVILSFMLLSVAIWSIFFFRFVLGMLCYIPCLLKIRKKGHSSLKKYCCSVVNSHVRRFVYKHHKPRSRLLEEGVLDLKEINENPLLNSASTATFDSAFQYKPEPAKTFQPMDRTYDTLRPMDRSYESLPPYGSRQNTYESLPLQNMSRRRPPYDPFGDENNISSKATLMNQDPFSDPKLDNDMSDTEDLYDHYRGVEIEPVVHKNYHGYGPPPRTGSASSLTFATTGSLEPVSRNHTAASLSPASAPSIHGPMTRTGTAPYPPDEANSLLTSEAPYPESELNTEGFSEPRELEPEPMYPEPMEPHPRPEAARPNVPYPLRESYALPSSHDKYNT
ncbi:putative vacuolar membrane protein [Meyerozyma sp. JA9]|nr:putative vacuolar membrane protein [Meyerozyma sp. JA9]